MVVPACNSNTKKAETGELGILTTQTFSQKEKLVYGPITINELDLI